MKFEFVTQFNKELAQKFLSDEFDQIIVVYNKFKSIVQQEVIHKQLYPVKPDINKGTQEEINLDYIFEPTKEYIVKELIPKSLKKSAYVEFEKSST